MGCSSSNILTKTNDSHLEENKKEENNENEIINQHNSKKPKKFYTSFPIKFIIIYKLFKHKF